MSPPAPGAAMSLGTHAPATQVPLPLEQAVPSAAFAGAGHSLELPVHIDACRQSAALAHSAVDGLNVHEAEQQEPGVPFAPGS